MINSIRYVFNFSQEMNDSFDKGTRGGTQARAHINTLC